MAAKISYTPKNISFGTVVLATLTSSTLSITNVGDALLTGSITMPSTLPVYQFTPASFSLAPGETQVIAVLYTPVMDGTDRGFLLITSNDPLEPAAIVSLTGEGGNVPNADYPQQPIDYDYSKKALGAVYPVNSLADAWGVLEPLISPEQLKMRHLFGIPLVSHAVDPVTGKKQVMTDPILSDAINRAVAVAELETHLDLFPKVHREKFPFDRQAYASLGYMMLPVHPIQSLEKLSVTASNNQDLYLVPPSWVETAYLHTGQINIVPMTIAFQMGGFFVPTNSPNGGAAFLSILGQNPWIPAYWQCDYTTGFPDGKFPTIINELIGIIAAIEVLSLLATTNARNTSHSVGVDGLSQSISTPGPQIYDTRITLLQERKQTLMKKIRVKFGSILFTSVI